MTELVKPVVVLVQPTVYHNVYHTPPISVQPENWISFDRFTTRVFQSDFCHDHHLTMNLRVPTTKSGYLKVKQQLTWKNGLKIDDQLRLWFPLSLRLGSYIYAHAINDKIKIHYDHGLTNIEGYNVNLYGSFDFLKNWTNLNGRIGISHTTNKVHTNLRLRLDEDKTVTLYHKTHLILNQWKFGFDGVVDFNKKSLLKKDLVIGYQVPDYSIYLKGIQDWEKPTKDYNNWREFFSKITLTALYRRNFRQLFGLEVTTDPSANKVSEVKALIEYQHSHSNRVKAKINHNFLLTFFLERKVNSQLTASLGVQLPLKKKETGGQKKEFNTKVGLKLAWNL